jgi:protein gp37
MQNSTIEWTNHTVNFWWGCSKVSDACRFCYAETVANVFGKRVFGTVPEWGPGKPRLARLDAAQKEAEKLQRKAQKARLKAHEEGRPAPRTLVFVNSMSDWLDAEVPTFWLATLLQTLATCPDVTFQLLTKRPENFRPRLQSVIEDSAAHAAEDWPHGGADVAHFWLADSPPKNVWVGTTVEDQKAADLRIPQLLQIPVKVRFLSCEPLLGLVELDKWFFLQYTFPAEIREGRVVKTGPTVLSKRPAPEYCPDLYDIDIHWVIAGGESGGPARASHPDWFYSLRDQCTAAGVPFFFKQWGEWLPSGTEAAHLPENGKYKPDRFQDGTLVLRAGTKLAGRQLHGREWNEYPAQAS